MAQFSDSVFINATPAAVEEWLQHIDAHYKEWHPAHLGCELAGEDITRVGTRFAFEELLHGKLHRLTAVVTRSSRDDGLKIEYRVLGLLNRILRMRGAFHIRPERNGCTFAASMSIWPPTWVASMLFGTEMAALREHMREEGENLKIILERENPPYAV